MMNKSANGNVIAAIFRHRMGNAGKTKLFHDLPEREQKLLVENARLAPDENPVIAFLGGHTSWCLVTDRGLAWLNSEGLHYTNIFDVSRFTHDMGAAMRRGEMDKRQFHALTVESKTGETAVVELEPGPPFYGVWRALDWMLEWANRSEQQDGLSREGT